MQEKSSRFVQIVKRTFAIRFSLLAHERSRFAICVQFILSHDVAAIFGCGTAIKRQFHGQSSR